MWHPRKLIRPVLLALAGIALLTAFAFATDAAWLRLRADQHGDATGTVRVQVMLAIPLKSGRTEFVAGGTEVETCTHSLFPHNGLNPCWYAERHTRKRIHY